MNRPITSKEVSSVIKSLLPKKSLRPNGSIAEFYKTFQEEVRQILVKTFQIIEREGTLPNSFCEDRFILLPKIIQKHNQKENLTPIFLTSKMQNFSTKY
jgi:hypothetical protein